MSISSSYKTPPIVEAVAQLVFDDSLSEKDVSRLSRKLKKNYSNEKSEENITAKVNMQEKSSKFDSSPRISLSSDDQADLLIIQPNALTWSRRAPYQDWDNFVARINYDISFAYRNSGFRKINRMGLRYINRIDVPTVNKIAFFEDYLAINIAIPDEISVVNKYAWRFEHEIKDKGMLVIVQSATVDAEIPETCAFLLDIDIVALDLIPLKNEDVIDKFAEMRLLKNRIFELSITDQARARFSE